jgi:hypothetical protein
VSRRVLGTAAWLALAGWGAALTTRPRATVQALCGDAPVPPPAVVRVLGARQLLQSLVLLAAPSRGVTTGAAAVDGLHAASMLAAAAARPRFRRPALTSAAVATVSALITAAAGRR